LHKIPTLSNLIQSHGRGFSHAIVIWDIKKVALEQLSLLIFKVEGIRKAFHRDFWYGWFKNMRLAWILSLLQQDTPIWKLAVRFNLRLMNNTFFCQWKSASLYSNKISPEIAAVKVEPNKFLKAEKLNYNYNFIGGTFPRGSKIHFCSFKTSFVFNWH